jgi:hypothetical protein
MTDASLARPRADGQIESETALQFAFMAPRLQGDFFAGEGKLELSVWGCGRIATFALEGWSGGFSYAPNRLLNGERGLYVAQSAPVLVLAGGRLKRARPAARCAWWATPAPLLPVRREGARRVVETGWGVAVAEERGDALVIAAGASMDEVLRGLALSVAAIKAEADAYVARCDIAPRAPALFRSMASQSAHASLSAIRRAEDGSFLGLAAGQAYSAPTRTYYRDGYWTLQALLHLDPEAVRGQIDLLATGLQKDGEAPSGVILTGPAQGLEWEKFRTTAEGYRTEHLRPTDWWSDHFDSPLFFVLTIFDYVRVTGDDSVFAAHWPMIRTIFERYRGFDVAGTGLPVKPRHDRDWADNVYRHGYVAYDIGLWVGCLDGIALHGATRDPELAGEASRLAARARASIEELMLLPAGWYADYGLPGEFQEDHLALDSLTLLKFDAVPPHRARAVLDAAATMLETRHNNSQPYGDWGVMCAWPPFRRRADTRAKSAFAYRYHNGSDWPYLSGLYAGMRLKYGLGGWDYPMTRWWQTCLENGWTGPVEYFAPPFGRGSLLQGWSGMHAAAILDNRATIDAALG